MVFGVIGKDPCVILLRQRDRFTRKGIADGADIGRRIIAQGDRLLCAAVIRRLRKRRAIKKAKKNEPKPNNEAKPE